MNNVVNKDNEDWRERQRKQVTGVTSIYLALSTAILGFVVDFLAKSQLPFLCKVYLKSGAILLLVSILSALLLTLNRLIDFRKTARLFKLGKTPDEVLKETQFEGKISWILLYSQLVFFSFAIVILVITFSIIL